MGKYDSVIHWDAEFVSVLSPMLDETFDEMDAETVAMLSAFFTNHRQAVKENASNIARRIALPQDTGDDVKLARHALDFAMQHPGVDRVAVGASSIKQMRDWEEWYAGPASSSSSGGKAGVVQ